MAEGKAARRSRRRRIAGWIIMLAAILAVPVSIAIIVQVHRGRFASDHENQARSCALKAGQLHLAGERAFRFGQKTRAAEFFKRTNYWSGQANAHARMAKEYRRVWWSEALR